MIQMMPFSNFSLFGYEISKETIDKLVVSTMSYLPKIVAALLILVLGLWVIKFINKVIRKFFARKDYDITLEKFIADLINWGLKVMLFIMVITQLGVQSSSLLAILGAAGLAIGLALQGSLSNFAGGVLILLFKPFKVGDFIEAQGQMGTVKSISIFTTILNTPGNQQAIIPNGKLSNDTIKNFNAEPTRRNFMTIGVSYDSDIKKAKDILLDIVTSHEFTLKEPAPEVVVANLGDSSVDLSLRFSAENTNYWKLNFYVLEEAKARLEANDISIPFPQRDIHVYNQA
ncbi:mechanosensitive ion channel family protein [Aquimarina agarivorans]|uniref:mechanosensitive ion channel family protein n=1 Tax=Aquimarina agarivorans TaxID=980584 RepID=UPI000248E727|nr:mechanosensitive ion channel domain-containing protein [Aquimarina agarivorans]